MHYAIGDVHGCYADLMKLIDAIERRDDSAIYFFVGDFVDRGPDVWRTLDWAKDHVATMGKYRSVRGNHEQMLIDWYPEYCDWYEHGSGRNPAPPPGYDFLERMIEQEIYTPEALRPYMDFFLDLPLKITISVPGREGRKITYNIVHAWIPPEGVPRYKHEEYYLWERENALIGNNMNDHVIIHGHTPTHIEHRIIPESVPGMINYRKNAINIDGGCVLGPKYPEYPCMLCAICLETLEEIYPYTIEERMETQMKNHNRELRKALTDQYEKQHAGYLENPFRTEILNRMSFNSNPEKDA